VGVEVIAELHRAAEENVARYRPSQEAAPIETLSMDARDFVFPQTPLVVYLFNPLPEAGLRQVMRNFEESWARRPRPVWIVYHNPLLESVLMQSPSRLLKVVSKPEYSVFRMISGQDTLSRQ
jgi:hypothetical protein